MLSNHLKAGYRNLLKYKSFTLINIVGLGISVAFCLLLYLNIRHEQSFDQFHVKRDRLFRLEQTDIWDINEPKDKKHFLSFLTGKDDVKHGLVFPGKVFGDLEMQFPEVEAAIPITGDGGLFVSVNGQQFKEEDAIDVGTTFFKSFSFRLLSGNAATALADNNNVVLSKSIAIKYFGTTDAVGQTIMLPDRDSMLATVTGVVEDAPANSSLSYSLIFPITIGSDLAENLEGGFNQSRYNVIVELKKDASVEAFEAKLNKWLVSYYIEPYLKQQETYAKPEAIKEFHWYLRPIADAHYNVSGPWGHYTNSKNMYQLGCLVLIILALSSINYVLLTVSNAARRSKEVGMRKILGAPKRTLVVQFWVETQLIVLVAVLAGFLLAWLLLPFYNQVAESNMAMGSFSITEIALALLCLAVVLGLIAGYYPALVLSRMKPASIVKGSTTFKINPRFSRIMIVAQYSVCIVLMIAAYVINSQMKYVNNKNLGFDKEQVLMVENQGYNPERTQLLKDRFEAWYPTEPAVIDYTVMQGALSGGGNNNGFKLNGEQHWLRQLSVGYDYFKMLDLEFVAGRPFDRTITADTSSAVRPSIVNETLFSLLGKEAALGVYNKDIRSTIIGVVKDYHFETLSKKIEPQQHVLNKGYNNYFLFKIQPGKMQSAIASIRDVYKATVGELPFEYTFLDEDIAHMYEADVRWQRLVQASCIFAVIIACMGLFGLSGINASNRVKEIGIRKVLGADVKDIVITLSLHFTGMIGIAILIGVPIAWWMMNTWLEEFQYRISLGPGMFALVSLIAVGIAMLTVSYQAIRAAIVNPVESLKGD